jgi:hypothetical protein
MFHVFADKRFFLRTICFFVLFFLLFAENAQAGLYRVYDLLEYSHPATSSNHSINFITPNSIPPSGRISVQFPYGLLIPPSFDYNDIDLASAASGTSNYFDRSLASSASAWDDGVLVATGTGGGFDIILNSLSGFPAGSRLRIDLGTNATFGAAGDTKVINAPSTGSYPVQIATYDGGSNMLDRGKTLVVMIDPVAVTTYMPKVRGNGLPSGVLESWTVTTIMSLTTNYPADCRYSTASGTPWSSMTDTFFSSDDIYHTDLITGLMSAMHYTFYVRCRERVTLIQDTTDYVIDFFIAAAGSGTGGGEGGGTGTGTGGGNAGGSSSGGSGGGGGSGAGKFLKYPVDQPYPPDLTLSGWAYPASLVTILQNDKKAGDVSASADGSFMYVAQDISKGIYTYVVWARDSDGVKSAPHTSTFWMEDNTQTIISNILIPPTIKLESDYVDLGAVIKAFGQSIPGKKVEVLAYSPTQKKTVVIQETSSGADGRWSLPISTSGWSRGTYELSARTFHDKFGWSLYGEKVRCGVGETAVDESPCAKSDINKDGKVNLVDFSILMFYWGATNALADINKDGKVNLVDFSIMMYCWTG